MKYTHHDTCRVCGSVDLVKYIDLGELPLSNNLCESPIERPERYPLQVMLCMDCYLSQLSIVVDPKIMFGHYVYRSSINKGYVRHCRKMAIDLKERYGLNSESFMIDIAGNDGALLREFRDEIGLKILNIDPAVNLGAICQATGIPTLTQFWGTMAAYSVLNGSGYGRADLITATNVFAHVDNVYEFLDCIKKVLKPDGVAILEFPYLIDFINNNEFDTIYFEHLSYFSIRPLMRLCSKVGLSITRVEKYDIHGGSVRIHLRHGEEHSMAVKDFVMWHEMNINFDTYKRFSSNAQTSVREFREGVLMLKGKGMKVAGFAASAKGNTLLNCAGITCGTMSYIVDETPEKMGRYSPGTHIPIVSLFDMQQSPPDYLVILSWNFKDEIMEKCRSVGYTGRFIIPIPYFEIIEN